MNDKRKVSLAVIKRLPRYYRALSELMKAEISRISSKELSAKMGITASQIRQDLNCFGGFGQQGYGYNVEYLHREIGNILGLNKNYKMIIIGAGNLGRALANYESFEKRGFSIIAMFDVDAKIIGSKIRNIEIMHIQALQEYVQKNRVDIAVLCTPKDQTQRVVDKIIESGIKAIWNFSPADIETPEDVTVENVHLSDSLMVLGYRLSERQSD